MVAACIMVVSKTNQLKWHGLNSRMKCINKFIYTICIINKYDLLNNQNNVEALNTLVASFILYGAR